MLALLMALIICADPQENVGSRLATSISEPRSEPRERACVLYHGCSPDADGNCPKHFHRQVRCPTDPRMKMPCLVMCMPDEKEVKKENTNNPKLKHQ